jgi:hypothetical protein
MRTCRPACEPWSIDQIGEVGAAGGDPFALGDHLGEAEAVGGGGYRTAPIHIVSNDADENPFDIAVADIARSVSGVAVEPIGSLSEVTDSGVGLRTATVTPSPAVFPTGRGFLRIRISE